jgi:hypothetical protein
MEMLKLTRTSGGKLLVNPRLIRWIGQGQWSGRGPDGSSATGSEIGFDYDDREQVRESMEAIAYQIKIHV